MSKSGEAGRSGSNNDWCTIESDPGVFTELLETLGCTTVQVEELWSLDDGSLERLCHSTKQVYGLIFLFKWNSEQHAEHGLKASEVTPPLQSSIPFESKSGLNSEEDGAGLFFAHQVTTNACATQALLSVVLNAKLSSEDLGATLTEFSNFTASFPPELKGVAISSSEEIKTAHNRFARPDAFILDDSTKVRIPSEHDEAFHFVAFVPFPPVTATAVASDRDVDSASSSPSSTKAASTTQTVYELDGLQQAPIVAGEVDVEAHAVTSGGLFDAWLVTARTAIQERMNKAESNHIKFNLLAVLQDPRIKLKQQLDEVSAASTDADLQADLVDRLAGENNKREQWKLENQRRRHNYVPLCVNVLRELAKIESLENLVREVKERKGTTAPEN